MIAERRCHHIPAKNQNQGVHNGTMQLLLHHQQQLKRFAASRDTKPAKAVDPAF
jgi:hypothetical protein